MQKQLNAGLGKKSYWDYIIVLNRYLIPYFGEKFVTSIDYELLQRFAKWRADKIGREPMASTLNTHNSALNRVFDEAVVRGQLDLARRGVISMAIGAGLGIPTSTPQPTSKRLLLDMHVAESAPMASSP